MNPSPSVELYVGIDIAAATFVAWWERSPGPPRRAQTFDQTATGIAALVTQLQATGMQPDHTLVGLEATSTYWIRVAVALHQAGYHVAVLNPKHVHNYAKSLPRRSKTDALDAQVIAQFVAERQPMPWNPPPAVYHELRQRLMARDALLEMRQQAVNQQHALSQWPVVVPAVTSRFETVMTTLDAELASLDAEIATTLTAGDWAVSAGLLLSIPGIGIQCAAWLLVTTFNFTLCDTPEAAVAYAGLSPLEHESGTSVRGRAHIGRGGNSRLRKVLYMAALSAGRWNPVLRPFYMRLRERGKPAKLAHCAVARKLVHLAWAVVP